MSEKQNHTKMKLIDYVLLFLLWVTSPVLCPLVMGYFIVIGLIENWKKR